MLYYHCSGICTNMGCRQMAWWTSMKTWLRISSVHVKSQVGMLTWRARGGGHAGCQCSFRFSGRPCCKGIRWTVIGQVSQSPTLEFVLINGHIHLPPPPNTHTCIQTQSNKSALIYACCIIINFTLCSFVERAVSLFNLRLFDYQGGCNFMFTNHS